MTAQEQSALHDILEECYDVQLELSDLGESYELLICDIEIVIEERKFYIVEIIIGCTFPEIEMVIAGIITDSPATMPPWSHNQIRFRLR